MQLSDEPIYDELAHVGEEGDMRIFHLAACRRKVGRGRERGDVSRSDLHSFRDDKGRGTKYTGSGRDTDSSRICAEQEVWGGVYITCCKMVFLVFV